MGHTSVHIVTNSLLIHHGQILRTRASGKDVHLLAFASSLFARKSLLV